MSELDPELERGARLSVIRVATNVAAELLADDLARVKTDTCALRIQIFVLLNRAERLEEQCFVLLFDAGAPVFNLDCEHDPVAVLVVVVVGVEAVKT